MAEKNNRWSLTERDEVHSVSIFNHYERLHFLVKRTAVFLLVTSFQPPLLHELTSKTMYLERLSRERRTENPLPQHESIDPIRSVVLFTDFSIFLGKTQSQSRFIGISAHGPCHFRVLISGVHALDEAWAGDRFRSIASSRAHDSFFSVAS